MADEKKQYLDWEKLQIYDELLKGTLSQAIENVTSKIHESILEFDSSYEFPSVGVANTLYIDKLNNKSYRWDVNNLKYYCVGSDYEDIAIINGCW